MTFKSKDEDFLKESEVKFQYQFPNKDDRLANSFKFYDLPIMGMGPEGKPFIELDSYLDLSSIDKVRQEHLENIEKVAKNLVYMTPFGLVPKEINNEKCLDSYLINCPDKHLNTPRIIASGLGFHEAKRYFMNYYNLTKSWRKILHLRKPLPFYEKNNPSDWNENIEHFPLIKKLIESLPFKHIGIALIFRSNGNSRLLIHRDSFARNLCSHHINISLSKTTRNVFVYDSIKRERIYLKPNVRSYTFNETDLHGADPQYNHLVLRVDGEFEESFAKKLGLENGVSFDWAYDKPTEFVKQVGKINIWEHTDI